MTTEWGALAGIFPVDAVTLDFLKRRAAVYAQRGVHPRVTAARIAELEAAPIAADADADYAVELTLDLDSVSPYVFGTEYREGDVVRGGVAREANQDSQGLSALVRQRADG